MLELIICFLGFLVAKLAYDNLMYRLEIDGLKRDLETMESLFNKVKGGKYERD